MPSNEIIEKDHYNDADGRNDVEKGGVYRGISARGGEVLRERVENRNSVDMCHFTSHYIETCPFVASLSVLNYP